MVSTCAKQSSSFSGAISEGHIYPSHVLYSNVKRACQPETMHHLKKDLDVLVPCSTGAVDDCIPERSASVGPAV